MKGTQDSYIWKRTKKIVPNSKYFNHLHRTFMRLGLHKPYERKHMPDGMSIGNGVEFCKKHVYKAVLLVGSNPGQASPDNSPFHPETKSRQFVDNWFDDSWCLEYENLIGMKTAKNKQLSKSQIKEHLDDIIANMWSYKGMGYKIVACGKIASMGLTMAEIEHFEMPHPSGLNRFWNDKEASKAKIKEMKLWAQNLPYQKEK